MATCRHRTTSYASGSNAGDTIAQRYFFAVPFTGPSESFTSFPPASLTCSGTLFTGLRITASFNPAYGIPMWYPRGGVQLTTIPGRIRSLNGTFFIPGHTSRLENPSMASNCEGILVLSGDPPLDSVALLLPLSGGFVPLAAAVCESMCICQILDRNALACSGITPGDLRHRRRNSGPGRRRI